MNSSQITKISLSPEMVDCIVFWTKNPLPIIKSLNILDKFQYYFHFTLTPYDSSIAINLPSKIELIDTFRRLSILLALQELSGDMILYFLHTDII